MKILFSQLSKHSIRMLSFIILILGLLTQGCLELEKELILSQDGSGKLNVRCILGESATKTVELLEAMKESHSGKAAREGWFAFSEDDLQERFKGDGIEITSSQFEKKDGTLHIAYTIAFDNIQNLFNTQAFQKEYISFYRDDSDNLVFQFVTESTRKNLPETMPKETTETFKIDFILTMPSNVLGSNADTIEGNTLTWHYTLEKQEPTILTARCEGTGLPFLAKLPTEAKKIATADYVYDPTGKPDPFRPFILEVRRPKETIKRPLQPLQRYEISQLNLVGIIWQMENPRAVFEDSAGKGYIVSKGSYIGKNEGRVTEILKDEVIITEKSTNVLGETTIKDIRVRLHETEAKSK